MSNFFIKRIRKGKAAGRVNAADLPVLLLSLFTNSTYLAFHTCTVLSPPPEAMYLPFGDHATACTSSWLEMVFFVYVKICCPVRPFQSWTVLAAEAMVLLSGDQATAC